MTTTPATPPNPPPSPSCSPSSPSRSSSRSSSPSGPDSSSPVSQVRVEWDGVRGLHVAVCAGCCETFTTTWLDQAHEWADTHTCDPELAALLTDITRRNVRRAA